MKIQNQVCTLQQAQKLKAIGIDQDTAFCFVESKGQNTFCLYTTEEIHIERGYTQDRVAAFSVAELGAMISDMIDQNDITVHSYFNDHLGEWDCEARRRIENEKTGEMTWPIVNEEEGDTEAEARASMLLWLLENKECTIDQINERLKAA